MNPSLLTYSKPFLTITQQIEQLKSRGMQFPLVPKLQLGNAYLLQFGVKYAFPTKTLGTIQDAI